MDWLARLIGRLRPAPAPPAAPEPPHKLETSIREHLAPLLREDGFTGSGRNYRRFVDGLALTVQVQGSTYGDRFAINLGLHPLSLPIEGLKDIRKITDIHCRFGRRLALRGTDQWWRYGKSRASMDAAVAKAARVYVEIGRPAFAALAAPDSPIRIMTAEALATGSYDLRGFAIDKAFAASIFATIRKAEGQDDAARAFARLALQENERTGNGTALGEAEMRAIIDG